MRFKESKLYRYVFVMKLFWQLKKQIRQLIGSPLFVNSLDISLGISKSHSLIYLEGFNFPQNRHFVFIQERFNKLVYSINMIIKSGILHPVKFQLVTHVWTGSNNEMIFYRISKLMLATFRDTIKKN